MTIRSGSRGREPTVGHSSLEAPFVGRTAEFEMLLAIENNATRGRGLSHPLGIALIGAGTTLLLAAILPA